jgi:hypothetical protein
VSFLSCVLTSFDVPLLVLGFADAARHLLKSKDLDVAYIPDPKVAASSPFLSAPCQSALGEAARCGFYKIVQVLLLCLFLYPCSSSPADVNRRWSFQESS